MNSGQMTLVMIGSLCAIGFVVVAVETRLHRRKLRRKAAVRDGSR
jgi:hypothetical protein